MLLNPRGSSDKPPGVTVHVPIPPGSQYRDLYKRSVTSGVDVPPHAGVILLLVDP